MIYKKFLKTCCVTKKNCQHTQILCGKNKKNFYKPSFYKNLFAGEWKMRSGYVSHVLKTRS